MLQCQARACIVPDSVFRSTLEEHEKASNENVLSISQEQEPIEITSIISSYAEQIQGERFSATRCGSYLWARFHKRNQLPFDLLFRLSPSFSSAARSQSQLYAESFIAQGLN
jgi:hypothetical protein